MPTRVAAINSSKLLIAIGNGASPETFTHPCMINTARGINFTSNATETLLPYCPPDEDLAGWIEREQDSLTAAITGAGVLDAVLTPFEMFWDWFDLGLSKHVHVIVGALGYWNGNWILPSLNIQGPGRREKVTFDCSMASDGPINWVATT